MLISDEEKAIDKVQHPFMAQHTGTEGAHTNITKARYDTPMANGILNAGDQSTPLSSRVRQRAHSLCPLQCSIPSLYRTVTREGNRDEDRTGRGRCPVFRWCGPTLSRPKDYTRKV